MYTFLFLSHYLLFLPLNNWPVQAETQHFFPPEEELRGGKSCKSYAEPWKPPEILELAQKAEPQRAVRAARVWGGGGAQAVPKKDERAGQMAPVILCSQSAL